MKYHPLDTNIPQGVIFCCCFETLFLKQEEAWKKAVAKKPKLTFIVFQNKFKTRTICYPKLSSQQRWLLAQFRLGILPIPVENDRFSNTAREDRKCEICDSGEVEDECHFLFQDVIKNCTDFQNLDVASQLSFLFENLAQSSAEHVAKCFSLRKSLHRAMCVATPCN